MKFRATFKTPDALDDAVRDAARDESHRKGEYDRHDENELAEELAAFASRWVKWGEYVTIEFDTEAGTATVVSTGT